MNVVERIQIKLKEKGLNIKILEKELNFGNGTIRRWDSNSPSCDKIEKVANYLNVSMDWIITGKEYNELNEEERELLEAYQRADAGTQKSIRKLLDIPENQSKSSDSQNGKAV